MTSSGCDQLFGADSSYVICRVCYEPLTQQTWRPYTDRTTTAWLLYSAILLATNAQLLYFVIVLIFYSLDCDLCVYMCNVKIRENFWTLYVIYFSVTCFILDVYCLSAVCICAMYSMYMCLVWVLGKFYKFFVYFSVTCFILNVCLCVCVIRMQKRRMSCIC